jgi:hypothetical protein
MPPHMAAQTAQPTAQPTAPDGNPLPHNAVNAMFAGGVANTGVPAASPQLPPAADPQAQANLMQQMILQRRAAGQG